MAFFEDQMQAINVARIKKKINTSIINSVKGSGLLNLFKNIYLRFATNAALKNQTPFVIHLNLFNINETFLCLKYIRF